MKKLHLILLSLLTVSLITYCPASSSGNPPNGTQPPTVDNMMPPPTVDNMKPPPTVDNMMPMIDITPAKTIHVHVRDDVSNNAEVVDLTDSITVTDPTYSIIEGNTANIFSINSSTGVITIADEDQITYDDTSGANNNNVHLLKVRVRNGTDTTKATEAPLRIVVRGENGAFITTWKTTANGEEITIPTTGDGYDFTVAWGDDSANETITMHNDTSLMTNAATNTYAAAGTYTVRITGVAFPRIYFNNADGDNKTKIQTVEQWGSTAWTSMENAFYGASNLTVPAVDAPDLTGVTSMQSMFRIAIAFNQDINHFDTSSIQDMSDLFRGATVFNQNISDWNTAMVTNMSEMFQDASAFNQDISTWKTGMVNDMSDMFSVATAFNQNINGWNTAMVTNMSGMFSDADAFNQDIGDWNTAKVTDMGDMFKNASAFNQDIGDWNTAMVNDMSIMFSGATAFDQDIGTNGDSWNTGKVTTMRSMFRFAIAFNQDIGDWNTAMVNDMSFMFDSARVFNQNIRMWNVSAVTNCGSFAQSSGLTDPMRRPDFNDGLTCN